MHERLVLNNVIVSFISYFKNIVIKLIKCLNSLINKKHQVNLVDNLVLTKN